MAQRITFNDTGKHEEAARMLTQGMKRNHIAKVIGVSNSTITNWAKRMVNGEIQFDRQPGEAVYYSTTPAQRAAIRSYLASGERHSPATLNKMLRETGLLDRDSRDISRHSIHRIRMMQAQRRARNNEDIPFPPTVQRSE